MISSLSNSLSLIHLKQNSNGIRALENVGHNLKCGSFSFYKALGRCAQCPENKFDTPTDGNWLRLKDVLPPHLRRGLL